MLRTHIKYRKKTMWATGGYQHFGVTYQYDPMWIYCGSQYYIYIYHVYCKPLQFGRKFRWTWWTFNEKSNVVLNCRRWDTPVSGHDEVPNCWILPANQQKKNLDLLKAPEAPPKKNISPMDSPFLVYFPLGTSKITQTHGNHHSKLAGTNAPSQPENCCKFGVHKD